MSSELSKRVGAMKLEDVPPEVSKRPTLSDKKYQTVDLLVNWFRIISKDHQDGISAENFEGRTVEVYKVEFFKVTKTKQGEKRIPLKGRDELRKLFWTMIRDYPRVFGNIFSNVFDDFYTAYTMRIWDLPEDRPTITQVLSQTERPYSRLEVDISWQKRLWLHLPDRFDTRPEQANETARFIKFLYSQRLRCAPLQNDVAWNEFIGHWEYSNNAAMLIPHAPREPKIDILPGVQAWFGVRAALKQLDNFDPVLNYGLVTNLFYQVDLDLITFYGILLRQEHPGDERFREETFRAMLQEHPDLAMNERQRRRMDETLGDIKIRTEYALVSDRRTGRFNRCDRHGTYFRLTDSPPGRIFVPIPREGNIDLFRLYQQHGIRLQFPYLPCVEFLSGRNKIAVPLELIMVHEKPQRYIKFLGYTERRNLVEGATLNPTKHVNRIMKFLERLELHQENDPFLKQFDMGIKHKMIECQGKVLEAPLLLDHEEKPVEMTEQKEISNAILSVPVQEEIGFALIPILDPESGVTSVTEDNLSVFYKQLLKICRERGINVGDENRFLWYCEGCLSMREFYQHRRDIPANIRYIEDVYQVALDQFDKHPTAKILFYVVFHERNFGKYGELKYFLDRKGHPNQVINANTLTKILAQNVLSPLYNISLKINGKCGGENQIPAGYLATVDSELEKSLSFEPLTMFIGIDVTHPTNQNDKYKRDKNEGPNRRQPPPMSIASMVGSFNASGTLYANEILAQLKAKETIELFDGQQFPRLINKFVDVNGTLPERVIIYRDGVSDSEMINTASLELTTIKREWANVLRGLNQNLDVKYMPKFTYIVVQKRHLTRFYKPGIDTKENGEKVTTYTNVPPGTLVDKGPVNPSRFDFFLTSHYGALVSDISKKEK
ncbi:hypothetical protein WR25_24810 isoform Q [Diploscapter pachys]|uniref:Uncharacterized protein n=1 Tax=Diploscapter pachys TaxID=2018661 RepID=A0A2A2LVE1_9BILA|nr:hypothetical protein WR25_24810 isoform P [Diploscapter pachys]PAV90154.1 hypothetical protein WR25_24810 isoform Q [Diploscapter pachys]